MNSDGLFDPVTTAKINYVVVIIVNKCISCLSISDKNDCNEKSITYRFLIPNDLASMLASTYGLAVGVS